MIIIKKITGFNKNIFQFNSIFRIIVYKILKLSNLYIFKNYLIKKKT